MSSSTSLADSPEAPGAASETDSGGTQTPTQRPTQTPTTPQYELWLASKVGGDDANRSFNECSSLSLKGALDAARLEAALRALLARHEALRCAFAADGQRFTVLPVERFALARHDLAALPEAERARSLAELVRAEVETPFVLEQAPLFRATLIRASAADMHRLLLTAHHAVCDGWSVGVLSRELAALYRAGASAEAAGLGPAPSFAAYSAALRARARRARRARDEAFWTRPARGRAQADRSSGPIAQGGRRAARTPRTGSTSRSTRASPRRCAAAGRARGVRVAGHAFWESSRPWLYRLTGQRDLVLGLRRSRVKRRAAEAPSAGRLEAVNAGLVGHCVHVLPLRMTVGATRRPWRPTFAAFGPDHARRARGAQRSPAACCASWTCPSIPAARPPPGCPWCLDVSGGLPASSTSAASRPRPRRCRARTRASRGCS